VPARGSSSAPSRRADRRVTRARGGSSDRHSEVLQGLTGLWVPAGMERSHALRHPPHTMELVSEFERIIDALQASGVDYAVCGGVALAIHGQPRATRDIDLLLLEA